MRPVLTYYCASPGSLLGWGTTMIVDCYWVRCTPQQDGRMPICHSTRIFSLVTACCEKIAHATWPVSRTWRHERDSAVQCTAASFEEVLKQAEAKVLRAQSKVTMARQHLRTRMNRRFNRQFRLDTTIMCADISLMTRNSQHVVEAIMPLWLH
eukprot:1736053-Pleurochrysis_carterae.AAC.1